MSPDAQAFFEKYIPLWEAIARPRTVSAVELERALDAMVELGILRVGDREVLSNLGEGKPLELVTGIQQIWANLTFASWDDADNVPKLEPLARVLASAHRSSVKAGGIFRWKKPHLVARYFTFGVIDAIYLFCYLFLALLLVVAYTIFPLVFLYRALRYREFVSPPSRREIASSLRAALRSA